MRSQTILRIGIYLLGVYAVLMSVTNGAYYLISFFTTFDTDTRFFAQTMTPHLLAYFVCPIAFALWAFGFADRSLRLLIGKSGSEIVPGISLSERALFVVGMQVLGVYLVVHHGSSCVSYLFEAFVHKARDTNQSDPRVVADTVYNIVGLIAGLVLCLKTEVIEKRLRRIEPGATDNPDDAQRI